MNGIILIIVILGNSLFMLIISLWLKKLNPIAAKFKGDDRFRITKYKNIFSDDYTKNGSKNICDWFCVES